jgi:hypothetical protein
MKAAATTLGLLFAALYLGAAKSPRPGTREHLPVPVCGHWVVKRILRTTNVQRSPAALEKYVGLRATYSASEMRFGKTTIHHPMYSVSRLSDAEFLRKSTIPLTQLGIGRKSVIVVEVRDNAGKDVAQAGTELFVRNRNEIITTWDGGYFELVRTGPCRQRQP